MLTARVFHREGVWWYQFVESSHRLRVREVSIVFDSGARQGPFNTALEASHAARDAAVAADEEQPPDAAATPD